MDPVKTKIIGIMESEEKDFEMPPYYSSYSDPPTREELMKGGVSVKARNVAIQKFTAAMKGAYKTTDVQDIMRDGLKGRKARLNEDVFSPAAEEEARDRTGSMLLRNVSAHLAYDDPMHWRSLLKDISTDSQLWPLSELIMLFELLTDKKYPGHNPTRDDVLHVIAGFFKQRG